MAYFLAESPIIQEIDIKKHTPGKAIFRMAVQDADSKNRNNRIYPKRVLENAINDCMDIVRSRSFYGELDHPLPSKDEEFNDVRQTTVLLKETSHIIRDFDWKGNVLYGEFETLSTNRGKDLLALILDKTSVGVSMRGLAELERKNDVSIVKDPLIIICYDMVSRPSHEAAVIDEKQISFESLFNKRSKSGILYEDFLNVKEKESGLICLSDGRCFLPDYFDKLIETKMIKFFKRWV